MKIEIENVKKLFVVAGFSHIDRASNIDLNAVRLAFQVFVKKDKKPNPIEPVVSEVIYDKSKKLKILFYHSFLTFKSQAENQLQSVCI